MARHAGKKPALSLTDTGSAPGIRHAQRKPFRHVRRQIATGLLGLVVFLASFTGIAVARLQGNIGVHDIDALLGDDRPTRHGTEQDDDSTEAPGDPASGEPINLLVFGIDARDEDSPDAGSVSGMRNDVTMVLHISADRDRVELVSIPRDTLVDIPGCTLPDGRETAPQSQSMFNRTFGLGSQTGDMGSGAACTQRTVESWTGIRIDDFVVVDFSGFQAMVDSLDGVPMYIPEPVSDRRAHLELEAGCQILDGHDALGFARARYEIFGTDGSDISRIGRQHELVAAIAREALSTRILTDPAATFQFLDATTRTLETGQWIGSLTTMAGLGLSLDVSPSDVRFATMPHIPAPQNPNHVVPTTEADAMWAAIREDRPIDADIDGTGDEAPDPAEEETDTPADDEPGTDVPTEEAPEQPEVSDPEPDDGAPPSCTRADV